MLKAKDAGGSGNVHGSGKPGDPGEARPFAAAGTDPGIAGGPGSRPGPRKEPEIGEKGGEGGEEKGPAERTDRISESERFRERIRRTCRMAAAMLEQEESERRRYPVRQPHGTAAAGRAAWIALDAAARHGAEGAAGARRMKQRGDGAWVSAPARSGAAVRLRRAAAAAACDVIPKIGGTGDEEPDPGPEIRLILHAGRCGRRKTAERLRAAGGAAVR